MPDDPQACDAQLLSVADYERADVLEMLLGEFDIALALAGAPRAAELNPSFVTAAPWLGAHP